MPTAVSHMLGSHEWNRSLQYRACSAAAASHAHDDAFSAALLHATCASHVSGCAGQYSRGAGDAAAPQTTAAAKKKIIIVDCRSDD